MDTDQEKQAAFAELLEEGKYTRKKKIGILVLALMTVLWGFTFLATGRILFGWPFAVIMMIFIRSIFQYRPRKKRDHTY